MSYAYAADTSGAQLPPLFFFLLPPLAMNFDRRENRD